MTTAPRILMAGGGTGGHVYPAIAIADAIRSLNPQAVIAFAGTTTGLEWTAVPRAGYEIHEITVSGFQRRMTVQNLSFPFKLLKGMKQSFELVKGFDPAVAVGTGGYVSGPVLKAAALKKKPVIIQEQNAFPGKTNLLLAKSAREIHIAFPEARDRFKASTCKLTGNPTRKVLVDADPNEGRRHFGIAEGKMVLFVFGGSGGSGAINSAVEKNLDSLLANEDLHLIWQTGNRYFDDVVQRVEDHERLTLLKYVDRMDLAYAVADVALCRAGAITCSEVALTGTPAILVPSPNVAEDHQTYNARSMADAGASILLPEKEMEAEMVPMVQSLLIDSVKRLAMSKRAQERSYPNADVQIAESVLAIAEERGHL